MRVAKSYVSRRSFLAAGAAAATLAAAGGLSLPAAPALAAGSHLPSKTGQPARRRLFDAKKQPWYELGMMGDPVLDSQLLWYLSAVYQGMADVGECLDTAHRVNPSDPWSWPREWQRTADRVAQVADGSLAGNHPLSAGQAYLRAASYYRAALIHHPEPADAGVPAMARQAVACFDRAIGLLGIPAQPVQIPYENTTLPGYFFRSPLAAGPAPVLIVHEGRDAWPEETKYLADAAMARGYHCLQFAGPGQGSAVRLQGLAFRPDWEKVVSPVVDFAVAQPGVDPARIALMGISMGGALAPRAAAFEKRIKVLIANPGVLSWADAILGHFADYPLLMNLLDSHPDVFDRACWGFFSAAAKLGDHLMSAATWWLKDSMWKHGVNSPSALIREMRRYTNADVVDKITCEVLVMDGEAEDFSAGQAQQLYDALRCPKEYMLFTAEDTGLCHCQTGALAVSTQRMFDWLDERL
jgi:alpha-beta hydrolase superfamily lysophospholipase